MACTWTQGCTRPVRPPCSPCRAQEAARRGTCPGRCTTRAELRSGPGTWQWLPCGTGQVSQSNCTACPWGLTEAKLCAGAAPGCSPVRRDDAHTQRGGTRGHWGPQGLGCCGQLTAPEQPRDAGGYGGRQGATGTEDCETRWRGLVGAAGRAGACPVRDKTEKGQPGPASRGTAPSARPWALVASSVGQVWQQRCLPQRLPKEASDPGSGTGRTDRTPSATTDCG